MLTHISEPVREALKLNGLVEEPMTEERKREIRGTVEMWRRISTEPKMQKLCAYCLELLEELKRLEEA